MKKKKLSSPGKTSLIWEGKKKEHKDCLMKQFTRCVLMTNLTKIVFCDFGGLEGGVGNRIYSRVWMSSIK